MNNKTAIFQKLPDILIKTFAEDSRILGVFLHGSINTDHFREDSDIDIALLPYPGQKVSSKDILLLSGELSTRLGRPVDLGVLTTGNLVYFTEVISKGTRIFCKGGALANRMASQALCLYVSMREDRREIEEAYHAA